VRARETNLSQIFEKFQHVGICTLRKQMTASVRKMTSTSTRFITTPMNLAIHAETSSLISEVWVTHFARCSESAVDIEQCECSRISLSFRHDCVLEWPASGAMIAPGRFYCSSLMLEAFSFRWFFRFSSDGASVLKLINIIPFIRTNSRTYTWFKVNK